MVTTVASPPVRLARQLSTGTPDSILPSELPGTVKDALELAVTLGRRWFETPPPTRQRWEVLATLAAHDLGVARAVEPHLDAVEILSQSGNALPTGAWGVFAAEGGDDPLTAHQTGHGWTLTGTKPWCSLAGQLDAALVTATTDDGTRQLFAVDLASDGVHVLPEQWHARGLVEIPSGPVAFLSVSAVPVGERGWYLTRPGFAWGGIGVAACWYGGAVGIARTVHAAAVTRPNPFLLSHLGAIDEGLQSARRALTEAAEFIDTGHADDPRILAKRVRATVARVCDDVVERTGRALGPAPLATDEAHAKRVADLQLYVRQHHAERDLESLGSAISAGDAPW
ncbi:MAG: acyl-CoA dehydrogenase family protein [Pseudolysinimonas sp.]